MPDPLGSRLLDRTFRPHEEELQAKLTEPWPYIADPREQVSMPRSRKEQAAEALRQLRQQGVAAGAPKKDIPSVGSAEVLRSLGEPMFGDTAASRRERAATALRQLHQQEQGLATTELPDSAGIGAITPEPTGEVDHAVPSREEAAAAVRRLLAM